VDVCICAEGKTELLGLEPFSLVIKMSNLSHLESWT